MAKAATIQRWHWWRRAPVAAIGEEAADFGTTFGLEMSLLETRRGATAGHPQPPRRGWLGRLLTRTPRG